MGNKSLVFTGGRAKVYVDNLLCGIYDSCAVTKNIGAEAQFVMGNYGPVEITPVSYEAVIVNCSGFRLIGNGAHKIPKFPKLQDLLNLESVTLVVTDRQTGEITCKVDGCVAINNSENVAAKTSSRIQVTYMGLVASDEEGSQSDVNGVDFPR